MVTSDFLRFAFGIIVEKIYYSKLGQVLVPFYELIQRNRGIKTVTVFDNIAIEVDSSKTGERAIPLYAFEPRVTSEVFRLLKPNDTVLDVGAWIGYYSLVAAKLVGPNGRIIAIEPFPDNLRRLAANISQSGFKNIEVVAAAVGERSGIGFLGEGASSSTFRLSAEDKKVGVRLTTIDSVIDYYNLRNVKLMIIDVEGYEHVALEGGSRCLSRGEVRNIICEIHPLQLKSYGSSEADVMTLLKDAGFKVTSLGEKVRDRPYHIIATTPNW